MKKVTLIARLLFGFVFLFGGIAFFLTPPPPMEPGAMADFFTGLMGTQYFFYLLKGTEIVCGAFLMSGFFVPLALVILAPIIINIFMVHAFMDPKGLVVALLLIVFEIYLAFFSAEYSPRIKQLFKAR